MCLHTPRRPCRRLLTSRSSSVADLCHSRASPALGRPRGAPRGRSTSDIDRGRSSFVACTVVHPFSPRPGLDAPALRTCTALPVRAASTPARFDTNVVLTAGRPTADASEETFDCLRFPTALCLRAGRDPRAHLRQPLPTATRAAYAPESVCIWVLIDSHASIASLPREESTVGTSRVARLRRGWDIAVGLRLSSSSPWDPRLVPPKWPARRSTQMPGGYPLTRHPSACPADPWECIPRWGWCSHRTLADRFPRRFCQLVADPPCRAVESVLQDSSERQRP
jgi:hypothetical protein